MVSMHTGAQNWGAQAANLGLATCVLYTTGHYISLAHIVMGFIKLSHYVEGAEATLVLPRSLG